MTEAEWSEEAEPKRKKGIPKWVWIGCGGGCLLAVVLGAVLAVTAGIFIKGAVDPEKQWPKVQQVLAFDERPQTIEITFGLSIPIKQFVMMDQSAGVYATLIQFSSGQDRDYQQMLDPEFEGLFGLGAAVDGEAVTMGVQGREVRALRYMRRKPEPEGESLGPGVLLDLKNEDGPARTIDLRRLGAGEHLTNEEVEAFLEPFDVWR